MTDDFLARFGGIARLYGKDSLEIFSQSHVMVIGLGGVGSWAVEALARSGIGTLSLIDLDVLCQTNINRQIHAVSETVGQPKTNALAQRISSINADARIIEHTRFYNEANSEELLTQESPDIIIDAIDSVRSKCHLLATCRDKKIPVITSGAAGGRIDPSQVQIDDLSRTHGDGLLHSVRKHLRGRHGFPEGEQSGKKIRKFGIPAIFSPEQPRYPQCDGSASTQRPEGVEGGIRCDSGYGAVTHLTATFGNLATAWTLNQLSNQASSSLLPSES